MLCVLHFKVVYVFYGREVMATRKEIISLLGFIQGKMLQMVGSTTKRFTRGYRWQTMPLKGLQGATNDRQHYKRFVGVTDGRQQLQHTYM